MIPDDVKTIVKQYKIKELNGYILLIFVTSIYLKTWHTIGQSETQQNLQE